METLHACSQKEENDMCHILYALAAPCDLHLTRCYVCIFGKMTLMHLNSRQRTLCLWSVIISKFSWLSVCTLPNLWKHTRPFKQTTVQRHKSHPPSTGPSLHQMATTRYKAFQICRDGVGCTTRWLERGFNQELFLFPRWVFCLPVNIHSQPTF